MLKKFVVREFQAIEYIDDKTYFEPAIGIGIKSPQTGNVIPSPLSNFIKREYRQKGKSISSQRNCAYAITRFLDFVHNNINKDSRDFIHLKTKGIKGLKLIHGSIYITSLSLKARNEQLTANYVNDQMNYLIRFYFWLKQQCIIDETFEIAYKEVSRGGNPIHTPVNPFNDIELETVIVSKNENVSTALVDFGSNRYYLAIKLINIAQLIAPDIALGVCFQFFGGLRRSEVINLTRQSVQLQGNGSQGIILKVRDNQDILFPNIKNSSHLQVKNPRNQTLLINDILLNIYHKHIEWLNQKNTIKNTNALFISKHTGNPITGKQYYTKFTKVKKELLKQLSQEENIEDYLLLSENDWSTHIGRGVFTNFLLDTGLNVTQIAIARGDSNINSALAYVDEKTAIHNMNEAVNHIREAYQNHESKIDNIYIKQWNGDTNDV